LRSHREGRESLQRCFDSPSPWGVARAIYEEWCRAAAGPTLDAGRGVPIRYPNRLVEFKGGVDGALDGSEAARRWKKIMRLQVIKWATRIARSVRGLGPYAALELLLPGGTLIVLLVLAVRNRETLLARFRGLSAKV